LPSRAVASAVFFRDDGLVFMLLQGIARCTRATLWRNVGCGLA